MRAAGVNKRRADEAWKVLSVILSWAASSHLIEEVKTNGCLLATERTRSRRRSNRSEATGRGTTGRRANCQVPAWALSPQAVEAIREQMLLRVTGRDPILALRDATVVSTQYGLAARNREVWGLRWERLDEEFAEILQVISRGELDEYGKTNKNHPTTSDDAAAFVGRPTALALSATRLGAPRTRRRLRIPRRPRRQALGRAGEGERRHTPEQESMRKWSSKFFAPAAKKVAEREELRTIRGATPYSLRRGGISVRLRAEHAQIVAEECGTSLEMLDRHYAFAMHDLRRHGPAPFNEVWSAARNTPTLPTE